MPKGRVALDPNAAVAKLPGFEILPNGKSRVFVQLSKTPVVEEKRGAGGALMYVLKDVHVERRNNTNPLLTMHWNTPVSRAQLVPSGSDLQFVIDLRTPVAPEWKLVNAEGGASVLMIEFASGSYLSRRSEPAPLPQARRNKRESNAPPEKVSLQGDGAGDPLDGNSEEESSSSGRAEPMPERDTAAAGSASR
jgi:hypothetical protein